MTNPYYEPTGNPSTGASGSSSAIRAEFNAIEDAFDKLPALSGTSLKFWRTNAGETAAEAVSGSSLLSQDVAFGGDISPSQITANQNDYNPTGLSTASVIRITTDASRNLTGLAGGADGRTVFLVNAGSFNFVLMDGDTGSSSANRFNLEADITVRPDCIVQLLYDSTSSRWRAVGKQSSAFMQTLEDDTTAAAARTTLGLGTAAVLASTDVILQTLADAKGDIIVATAADTWARKAVGATNEHVLQVDSTQSDGLRWGQTPFRAMELFGVKVSNNVSDATNDIDIAAGASCRDRADTANMVLASALTKQLDAAWAVGSAAGMLDTGSIANGTWHIHEIKRTDTGVVDIIASLATDEVETMTVTIASPGVVTESGVDGLGHGRVNGASVKFTTTGALPTGLVAGTVYFVINRTATTYQLAATQGGAAINTTGSQSGTHTAYGTPVMPTNYDKFRRIFSILREGATIAPFDQRGDLVLRDAAILDFDATNPGTSAVTRTLSVPTGINVESIFNSQHNGGTGVAPNVRFTSLAIPDVVGSFTAQPLADLQFSSSATGIGVGGHRVMTNKDGQIRSRLLGSASDSIIRGATTGWIDTRGRI